MAEREQGRRALLAGGAAAMAGAVILGAPEEAGAANGGPILLGKANSASAVTSVTTSGTSSGLSVTNTNAAGTAHAIVGTAKRGYGLIGSSTSYHGAKVSTPSPNHHGLTAQNLATTTADEAKGCAIYAQHHSTATSHPPAVIRALQGPDAERALASRKSHGVGEFAGNGHGVMATSTQTGRAGVLGFSRAPGGHGVLGEANGYAGIGVVALSTDGWALYTYGNSYLGGSARVEGNLLVMGNVSKLGGSFQIDHPLDPANKYLSHSFVESPDMMNVYNGNVEADANGEAAVELPEWFESLNQEFRYQLTSVGSAAPDLHVKTEVAGNSFSIAGARPGQKVSWQVTGIRQDAWAKENRIPVEHAKPKGERGRYLFPAGFGASEDQSVFQPQRDLIAPESW